MRYFLLGVFVAALALPNTLHAQSRGKIAIVRSHNVPTALDTVVQAAAVEPVEIDYALPANLDDYDAVFLQPDFILDSSTQAELVNYMNNHGKLYVEGLRVNQGISQPIDSTNPFWLRIGVAAFQDGSLNFPVDTVFGTDSEFTRNISAGSFHDLNGIEDAGPTGKIIPILFAGDGPGAEQAIAYISKDTSIRVVIGNPPDPFWSNYYSEFIADVFCDYFNLCAADVKTAPQIEPANTISVVHDSRNCGFSVSGNFSTDDEISVMNLLGTIVWHSNIRAGKRLVALPNNLRNGIYFVTIRERNALTTTRFAIVE